jgi:hypothetical protein
LGGADFPLLPERFAALPVFWAVLQVIDFARYYFKPLKSNRIP